MKLTTRLTNLGIELSVHRGEGPKALEPAADADQKNPRRSYVYAHMTNSGKIFYVGRGEGRRAWSTDRHPLWRRYVEKHLGGNYQVRILQDNLSAAEAERAEAGWIAQCSDDLVNWINMGRVFDSKALDQYHKLRDANRALIQEAKGVEKRDLVQAVEMYVRAIEAIPGYAFINYETGLVGQLLADEADELGRFGEIQALERLTMCLIRLQRPAEAAQHADRYFAAYRRDLSMAASQRIAKRIHKALGSARSSQAGV
jgi:hypothetical protein